MNDTFKKGEKMKKKLAFKNLFKLAWADCSKHFTGWLSLFGMQFITLALLLIVLFGYSYYVGSSSLSVQGSNFFIIESKFFSIITILLGCFFSIIAGIVYPIMNQQNALDIAFKRKMSGFDINNRFFSFAFATLIYTCIVGLAMPIFFIGIFLAQRWRFVGLHILEHGGNIRQAFKASWRMTRGYVWFFIGIYIVEWLLTLMIGWTVIGYFVVVVMNCLVNAHMYKQLHMEMDKDIEVCSSCES